VRLVWAIIPLVLFGIVGMQESDASCIAGEIRIDDSKYSSQHIVIGKDTLQISGKFVSLLNQTQDVLLTIVSSDTVSFQTCGSARTLLPNYLPNYANEGLHFEKISSTFENIFLKSFEIRSFEIELKPLKPGTYNLRTVALTDSYVNIDGGMTIIVKPMSLKKQIASGILPEDIICKEGLWLAFKARDNSPICIKSENVNKFFERNFITKFFKEGKSTYTTPKISLELQEIMDSGVERVDVRIALKNTPKPPPDFLKMTDEEQVANLQERYAQIRMMQQDLVDYITNNDGVVIKQLEFINSVYADVPVTIIDELKNRDDIRRINYYDKDAKSVPMPIHPPG